MEAALVTLAGPLAGRTIALDRDEVSIGRLDSNQVALDDPQVSRQHCIIRRQGAGWEIRDCGSTNGIAVNGIPSLARMLTHNDRVEIGSSLFLVVLPEQAERPSSSGSAGLANLEDATVEVRSALLVRSSVASAPADRETLKRQLETLLQACDTLDWQGGLEDLAKHLLDVALDAFQMERAALLLGGAGAFEPESSFTRTAPGATGPVKVSRTVFRRVLSQAEALCACDVTAAGELAEAESVAASPVRSLIAAPLMVRSRVTGVLYLDSSRPAGGIGERELRVLAALTSAAAAAIENARRVDWLQDENRRLSEQAGAGHNMIGESACIRRVYGMIERIARSDCAVLIQGESGTGKELAARAIHRGSARVEKPFVAINCAVLIETLLESELFGHEKGAFTGAISQKIGKIEMASGGTLFLDEIAELAPPLQAKLLRVLQEQEFERVGGVRPIRVDIRVIAATNRELESEIEAGRFRRDLFYRLKVVDVTMPPLRERREDIPLLARFFATQAAKKCPRRIAGLAPETRDALMRYDWPGNVRELQNAIERAVVMGFDEWIRAEDLPEEIFESAEGAPEAAAARYHDVLQQTKIQMIRQAVDQAGGSFVEAARLLGLHPNYLHRLVRNLGIRSSLK